MKNLKKSVFALVLVAAVFAASLVVPVAGGVGAGEEVAYFLPFVHSSR